MDLENRSVSFLQLLETSVDATILVDLTYLVTAANRAFEELFGFKSYAIIGKNLQEYLVPSEAMTEIAYICEKAAAGEITRLETSRRHADGHIIPVCLTAYPIIDEDKAIGIWLVYLDQSERIQNEERLRESENRLRDFAHAVPDMSLVVDEDGRYIEVFGNVEKMLDRHKEDFQGRSMQDMLPPMISSVFLQTAHEAIQSGRQKYAIREMKVRNRTITAEERVVPLRYTVNGKKTVGVVITDITDRQRMERMLYDAYQLQRRSDFINRILFESDRLDASALAFANKIGIDFSLPMFCCLLRSEVYAITGIDDPDYDQRRKLKGSLIDLLEYDSTYIVWDCQSDIGVLCRMDTVANPDQKIREMVDRLEAIIGDFAPGLAVIVGVGSSLTGTDGLKKSYRHAWNAVAAADCERQSKKKIQVCYYKRLGLLKFPLHMIEESYLEDFIEDTIGKVVEYDQRRRTDLLHTLEAIVHTFSIQAAAEKVFLHPKTIYYRKHRIEKILGCSIDSMDTRSAIVLAIYLYKMRQNTTNFAN